jgi:hypothetical protein
MGGLVDLAGVDLGNGTAALAVISVTRTAASAGPYAASTQILAADVSRLAATIVNNDTTKNLYIGLNGATATTSSTIVVPPKGAYNVPADSVAGQINGIQAAGASGTVSSLATTA